MHYDNTLTRRMQKTIFSHHKRACHFCLLMLLYTPPAKKFPKKHNFFNVPEDKRKKDPDRVFTSITLATFIPCKEFVSMLKFPQSVITI